MRNSLTTLLIVVFVSACASTTQYIPSELKDKSSTESAEVIVNIRVSDFMVDGVRVEGARLVLAAGTHSVQFKTYAPNGTAEFWAVEKRLNEQGCIFDRGDVGGLTYACNNGKSIWIPRLQSYLWQTKSGKVDVAAGGKYKLSDLPVK